MLKSRRKPLARIGESRVDHDVRCSGSRPVYARTEIIEHQGDRHRVQHFCADAGDGPWSTAHTAAQFLCSEQVGISPCRRFGKVSQLLERIRSETARFFVGGLGEDGLVHYLSDPAVTARLEIVARPRNHGSRSTHVLEIFLGLFDALQAIESRGVSVAPADIALIYGLSIMRDLALASPPPPSVLQ